MWSYLISSQQKLFAHSGKKTCRKFCLNLVVYNIISHTKGTNSVNSWFKNSKDENYYIRLCYSASVHTWMKNQPIKNIFKSIKTCFLLRYFRCQTSSGYQTGDRASQDRSQNGSEVWRKFPTSFGSDPSSPRDRLANERRRIWQLSDGMFFCLRCKFQCWLVVLAVNDAICNVVLYSNINFWYFCSSLKSKYDEQFS